MFEQIRDENKSNLDEIHDKIDKQNSQIENNIMLRN